jgi:hypothetical protein
MVNDGADVVSYRWGRQGMVNDGAACAPLPGMLVKKPTHIARLGCGSSTAAALATKKLSIPGPDKYFC